VSGSASENHGKISAAERECSSVCRKMDERKVAESERGNIQVSLIYPSAEEYKILATGKWLFGFLSWYLYDFLRLPISSCSPLSTQTYTQMTLK
jgi:hypothetical protein